MKCVSCGSELPGGAEYCAKCGVKVGAAVQPLKAAAGPSKKGVIALTIGAIALAALAGYFGWRAFAPSGKVVEAVAQRPPAGPLTESAGRVAPAGPLLQAPGTAPAKQPEPTDIIEYLRFVKEIEKHRVLLARTQMGDLLKQSANLTYAGAMADWSTNEPEQKHREVYQQFQASLGQWSTDWQELTARFLAYPKPVPPACAELRDRYYNLLGVTSTAFIRVGQSFSEAMSGDPNKALDMLTQMQGSGLGSASKEIGDACNAADEALAAICDKYRLKKDFDIRDDLGGGNVLGR